MIDCWYKDVCNQDTCGDICIRYAEMKYLLDHSNIPKSQQRKIVLVPDNIDLEAFRYLASIKSNIVDFVENGKNLYITSQYTGNGKTSWAIKLMLKYFDSIWAGNGCEVRGIFISVPTFLAKCKQFDYVDKQFNELRNRLNDVDLVIWDDIGSTGLSNYDHTNLLMSIDTRILANKSNIFTGNIEDYGTLSREIGKRLASRVESSDKIILKGKDRRI